LNKLAEQISGFTGKLLRDRFGKGPESVNVTIEDRCAIMHIRNFIGPVEKFLLSQQEEQAFRYTRELMMKSLLPELESHLKVNCGMECEKLYYEWGLHNASGMIVGLSKSLGPAESYQDKQAVHTQIIQLSSEVQKVPARIDSWWTNPKTLIIIREGILIKIEKELISLGYENTLKSTKRKLEKRTMEEETDIAGIFGKKLSDFYVDWDFEKDKSVIVYTFQ
jgi:uncharacterized protein YbcI